MNLRDLTIIVPCYNEEHAIRPVLEELLAFCSRHECFLLVVNDGSTDATGEILASFESPWLTVVTHKKNRGYGGAIKTGIAESGTAYVVTVDADGQHRPEDIERLYAQAVETGADMAVGERPANSDASFYRKIGKALIRRFVSLLFPLAVRDINSGMKLYSRSIAEQLLPLCPDGMTYSDVILMLFTAFSCRIVGVPIEVRERLGGVSTVTTMTAMNTLFEILVLSVMLSPFSFFSKISFVFLAGAVGWGIRCYVLHSSFSTGSSAMLIVSVLLFFDGLIMEQICRWRRQNIRIRNYTIRK